MSQGITEKEPVPPPPPDDWRPVRERAPSVLREDEPQVARFIGMVGLLLVTLGAVALVVNAYGRVSRVGPGLGTFCLVLGLGGMLLHAARDKELQVRRLYGLFGLLWLLVAAIVSSLPTKFGPAGSLFLPYGFVSLSLGLLFLLAFVHNETDEQTRDRATLLLGAIGAGLALTGFIGGNVSPDFLLPYGVLLALLGLAFGWAFITLKGTATDEGYRAGLALGGLGLLAFVVALGRSVAPLLSSRLDPYLVPSGLLLMGMGLLYLGLSAGLVSDNLVIAMTRRELSSFFYSPVAYIVLVVATAVAWVAYLNFLNLIYDMLQPPAQNPPMEPVIQFYIIAWWPIITLLLAVPLLTMSLLSEERRSGSLELLLTAPVNEFPIVFSKFLAALLFFLVVCLPWALFMLALRIQGGQPFDYRPLLSFFIALVATGAAMVSVGLFFSSLTRSQIASAILTFVFLFVWMLLFFFQGSLSQGTPLRTIMQYVSFVDLWMDAVRGTLSPRHLLFYASVAVFWLFLTVKVLEARKWS
jgi:ABC-2 type transport system permease protein